MNMHYLTYVFIPTDADVDDAVAAALRPFSAEIEVKPWKRHLDSVEIAQMAKFYGIPKANAITFAGHMKDWNGGKGDVDADGLFVIHTFNPDGKWDWYEIGGRWNRIIPENVQGARLLLKHPKFAGILPHDFLTPDGKWHEVETFVPTAAMGGRFDRIDQKTWLKNFKAALHAYADYRVVSVDRHS